jgi:hypothetical protein
MGRDNVLASIQGGGQLIEPLIRGVAVFDQLLHHLPRQFRRRPAAIRKDA